MDNYRAHHYLQPLLLSDEDTPLCSFILYQRIRILPVAELDSRLRIHFPWPHWGLFRPKEFKSTTEDCEGVNKSSTVNSATED